MSAPFFWMSFATEDGFLGCIVTRAVMDQDNAPCFPCTLQKTHDLGINPGGEVMSFVFSDEAPVPPEYVDRLMNREEAERLGNILNRPN